MMACDCIETRVPRITWYGTDLSDYLQANGVLVELCDYQGEETVVISRAPGEDAEPIDIAKLLADFVPSPPPPSRDERIAAATTLDALKAALLERGG